MFFALGLAQRAGKVVSGDFAIKSALKSGKLKLLIIAEDTAENSKKDLLYLGHEAKVPIIQTATRAELGMAIGKAPRAAVGIIDHNFVKMLGV